jgi:multidrug efflux pump subunit AcrA (membrane-fusion protein)
VSDIDTAAIRAGSYQIEGMTDSCRSYWEYAARLLCDALDAARAERDDATRLLDEYESGDMADLNAAERRAEAAEARIAAAMAMLPDHGIPRAQIRRALTGGTE